MIIDFHTHLGAIFPRYEEIRISQSAPPPRSLMISSASIEDSRQLFYRKRPHPFSLGFLKHVAITLWRRKRVVRGMVAPNLLHDMRQNGIKKSVVLPIEYPDGIERSAQLIQACQTIPHLIPFCSVYPKDPQNIEKLRRYLNLGARGLKLHPCFQRIRPDDPDVLALCSAYASYRLPLLLHSGLTGREGNFRHHRKFSSLEFLEAIPKQYPQIPVILAHAGISQYSQAIRLARTYDNVYLELSGQPARHIEEALAAIGSERLLFGSDWPFWNQALALKAVRLATQHDSKAERHILYENAEALLLN